MHGEILRLLFLQAHWETEAHLTATGMPSQRNNSDMFRFRRAAFYQGLQSKVGLAAAKPAALRINLNLDGCGVVAPLMHASSNFCPVKDFFSMCTYVYTYIHTYQNHEANTAARTEWVD